jgi:hypothetical protein
MAESPGDGEDRRRNPALGKKRERIADSAPIGVVECDPDGIPLRKFLGSAQDVFERDKLVGVLQRVQQSTQRFERKMEGGVQAGTGRIRNHVVKRKYEGPAAKPGVGPRERNQIDQQPFGETLEATAHA